jgi:hypothetical protein
MIGSTSQEIAYVEGSYGFRLFSYLEKGDTRIITAKQWIRAARPALATDPIFRHVSSRICYSMFQRMLEPDRLRPANG